MNRARIGQHNYTVPDMAGSVGVSALVFCFYSSVIPQFWISVALVSSLLLILIIVLFSQNTQLWFLSDHFTHPD